MKQAGQLALVPFPYTDLTGAKLRPVLLVRRASRRFDDWLVCMVSPRLSQAETGLDEMPLPDQPDFVQTGLKAPSVSRLSRLAVVQSDTLLGAIGNVSGDRFRIIRQRLGHWIAEDDVW